MKSTKDIINEIQKSPLYDKIRDLQNFLKLLSPTHQQVIAFIYIKERTLFIACKHNLGLQELKRDSNINLIKELLKTYVKLKPLSNLREVSDVKFFVATEFMAKRRKKEELLKKAMEIKPYFELSKGKFKNNIKDEKIHAKFEEIRELILASN
ncbi:MAG: hypothetical protein GX282_02500 [Campylobacteraceae bacterium]|nr:hypothetical protein [Campylobacteraceae bacterium]